MVKAYRAPDQLFPLETLVLQTENVRTTNTKFRSIIKKLFFSYTTTKFLSNKQIIYRNNVLFFIFKGKIYSEVLKEKVIFQDFFKGSTKPPKSKYQRNNQQKSFNLVLNYSVFPFFFIFNHHLISYALVHYQIPCDDDKQITLSWFRGRFSSVSFNSHNS